MAFTLAPTIALVPDTDTLMPNESAAARSLAVSFELPVSLTVSDTRATGPSPGWVPVSEEISYIEAVPMLDISITLLPETATASPK